MRSAAEASARLHVPLSVQDALRRGRPGEAARLLREANPGLDPARAKAAVADVARHPPGQLEGMDAPAGDCDTLPTEVAAKLATGNTRDAARRLRETQPGLSEEEAQKTVERHASPLMRQARTETVVHGDSGQLGWLGWVLLLLVAAGGMAFWQAGGTG
ncbi:hypothetical protein [Luteimonas abyssi]|uniref:hypothetical protein n=1 Tax=Luteimonas abyssi TaxID=1247514 RepID=UPI000737BE8C|nr:hypothetical protein [Luteimonas abyssi]